MIEHEEVKTQTKNTKFKNKGGNRWVLVVVMVVIILAALAVGFHWGKNEAGVNMTVQDLTADWSLYKSEKYGFSFKHPKEWEISFIDNQALYQLVNKEDDGFSINLKVNTGRTINSTEPIDAIQISIPFDKKSYLVLSTSTNNAKKEIFYNIAATLEIGK